MVQRRLALALIAFALLSPLPAVQAQASQRCFPETGKCIAGVIRTYWETNGGLAVFGFPTTDLAVETNADGFTGPTQWFERDRLEDHAAEGVGVLAGRLGAQKLALEGRPWETLPKVAAAAASCRVFPETGHSLCPPFRAYWERNGGLARFGFPISEPVVERNADGFTGTFQWFERRRMEQHPENQPPYDMLLGLLGNEVRGTGGTPPPPPPPPPPSPPPPPPPPSFNGCQEDPDPARAPEFPVRIMRIDKEQETVVVRNVSSTTVDLTGWHVCSITGNQEHQGIGGLLAPGQTRTFPRANAGNIWNNSERDDGALYDAQGRLIDYYFDDGR